MEGRQIKGDDVSVSGGTMPGCCYGKAGVRTTDPVRLHFKLVITGRVLEQNQRLQTAASSGEWR